MIWMKVFSFRQGSSSGLVGFQQQKGEQGLGQQVRQKLNAQGAVTQKGLFEVLAITAGDGNGWIFTPETLKESLDLWDGTECFIDHSWWERSVRDLAGVFYQPEWAEVEQGVRLKLKASGPGGILLTELGKEVIQEAGPQPRIGFSADILFTAKGKQVEQILRVYSVDLVYNPARGGAFLRALNSSGFLPPEEAGRCITEAQVKLNNRKGNLLKEKEQVTMRENFKEGDVNNAGMHEVSAAGEPVQFEEDRQAVRLLLDEQKRQAELGKEAAAARQVRVEMCAYLLESAMGASKLPAALQKHVKAQFAGRIFEPVELHKAVEEARGLVSELTGGMTVQGPARLNGMFSTRDQLQAAADDLLGAPRERGAEGLNVHKLQGVRELYMLLTGDYDLHGGYYADRVQLASTVDFTGIIKNALNKVVVNQWEVLGRAGYDWWKNIVTVEHFNTLNTITGTLVGTVGTLPPVAEGAEYEELEIGDSPETGTFYKYGGYIPLTLELIDRDETRKLAAYPKELANAGLRKISALVAAIFGDNDGTGPLMADGGALFNATAVSTAGGHANLLTTALAASQWEVVSTAVYNQPMLVKNAAGLYGSGPKMAINPKYCLVPRALQLAAMKVLYPSLENAANIYSENQQRGQPGDVITVPEWTDGNNWAAVCDPRIAPAIFVGERFGLMPEVFIAGDHLSPAVFTNDEHRLKVRHFLAVWVNDYRPLHKSNVSG